MAAPAKLLHVLGLLAKEESTYGTFVALATTSDGIQLQYNDNYVAAPFSIDYAFDGDLGPGVATLGTIKRVAPSGRSVKGDLPHRMRPGGAAYSATVVPSGHRLLKASGLDAAVTTTTSAEKWVYTPTAANAAYASLSAELYTRGEKWPVAGILSDFKIEFGNPAPPIWTFMCQGILNALPTDVSAPTITYPLQTVAPPLASSIQLTLGNFTSANAVVMSGSFEFKRTLFPRVALSGASAHLGFVPGDRTPVLKVVLEATALTGSPFTAAAAFDPYNLRDSAQNLAVTLVFGATQYNRYTLAMPQAQVIDVQPGNNGPIATVELTIVPYVSAVQLNDDFTLTFD